MDLLNPWLLGFGAAAAVPVVLHLIMRQKPKHLLFPALRFVRQRTQSNRRRLRLRHLLLLLLRVAALCLLALAIARPSISTSGALAGNKAPISMAMVFDTSPRMLQERNNKTRLQAARDIAEALLAETPADSQVAVMESGLRSAAFEVDLAAAHKRLEGLETTYTPDKFVNVMTDALELLKSGRHEVKELYVFTDLSRAVWSIDAPETLQQQIEALEQLSIHVVDVGIEKPRNVALGQLRLGGQVLARNSTVVVRTDVSRIGDEPGASEVVVHLNMFDEQGRPQKRDQETLELAAGEAQELEFLLTALNSGTHQGEVRVLGADGLEVDNRRFFTVEVKPAWRVLLAAPSPAEHYAFDLREALAPEPLRQEQRERFACDIAVLDELTERRLDEYAAVCVLDPTPLPATAWGRLTEYVEAGGRLALFLGRHAEPVQSFNATAAQKLLPGKLVQKARWPDGTLHLAPTSYQHPMLAKFRPFKDQVPWTDLPVFAYWQVGELNEGVREVLPYSNGQPAVLQREVGEGTVVTFTTPVSDELDRSAWNMLPTGLVTWPFTILSNELMLYLVGSADEQLNYLAGPDLTVVLDLQGGVGVDRYLLRGPSEQTFRPSDPNEPRIVVSSLEGIGNFRVERKEVGLDRGFSVNLDAAQTDLTRAEENDLKLAFGETPYNLARSQEEIERNVRVGRSGHELFPWLIALVAIALGIEHVLANRFYGKE